MNIDTGTISVYFENIGGGFFDCVAGDNVVTAPTALVDEGLLIVVAAVTGDDDPEAQADE